MERLRVAYTVGLVQKIWSLRWRYEMATICDFCGRKKKVHRYMHIWITGSVGIYGKDLVLLHHSSSDYKNIPASIKITPEMDEHDTIRLKLGHIGIGDHPDICDKCIKRLKKFGIEVCDCGCGG
jgi:hypothetical protein